MRLELRTAVEPDAGTEAADVAGSVVEPAVSVPSSAPVPAMA